MPKVNLSEREIMVIYNALLKALYDDLGIVKTNVEEDKRFVEGLIKKFRQ